MSAVDRLKLVLLGLLLWLPGLATPVLVQGLEAGELVAVVLLTLFVLALPLCMLSNWRHYFLLWLPLVPLIPVYVYLCGYYRSVPGDVLVSAALHTDWRDSLTMVASFGWKMLWVPAVTVGYLGLSWSLGAAARWRWRKPTLALVLLYAMVGLLSRQDLAQHVKLPPLFDAQTANLVFPLNAFLSVQRSLERDRREKLGASVQGRSLDTEPLLVVLVIGESVRRDHLSLNGYARPTTPWMDRHRQELISFRNVASTAQWTAAAVPHIVTREIGGGRASLIQTFKEAGFKTAWLSNQEVTDLSRAADVFDHSTDSQDFHFRKDTSLLLPFQSFARQSGPRQLIVLHMMGSHFPYEERYTSEARVFRPTLSDAGVPGHPEAKHKLEAINSYDNTVVALDQFMARLIGSLRAERRPVLMLYTSDHGESLFDDKDQLFMHARPTPSCHDLEVPLLVWANDDYRRHRAPQLAAMQANLDRGISHRDVFPTVLDLAGIAWSGQSAADSFASPAFVEKQRSLTDLYGRPVKTYDELCRADAELRPSSRPTLPAPRH